MFSPYVSGSVKRQPMAFVMAQWALVFSALQVTLSVRRTPGNLMRDSTRKHLTSSFTVQCRSQIWAEAPLKVTSVLLTPELPLPCLVPWVSRGCAKGDELLWLQVVPFCIFLALMLLQQRRILEILFLLPDWLFTYPKQVIAYFPDRNFCCKASSLADC